MSPTPNYDGRPQGPAEELIASVFQGRMTDADPQVARLRLERQLRGVHTAGHRPALRTAYAIAISVCALFVLGGWATAITLKPWDDAQQVTIQLPAAWTATNYPRLVGML